MKLCNSQKIWGIQSKIIRLTSSYFLKSACNEAFKHEVHLQKFRKPLLQFNLITKYQHFRIYISRYKTEKKNTAVAASTTVIIILRLSKNEIAIIIRGQGRGCNEYRSRPFQFEKRHVVICIPQDQTTHQIPRYMKTFYF